MPSSRPEQRYVDILINIDRIEMFVDGMDFEAFDQDIKTYMAVERCLSIISEAAVKLGRAVEIEHPEVAWGQIRGLGNQLRHAYDGIDRTEIWNSVKLDLASLRSACRNGLVARGIDPDAAVALK